MEPECAELSEAKPKFPAFALLGLLRVPKSHAPPRNRYIASAITGRVAQESKGQAAFGGAPIGECDCGILSFGLGGLPLAPRAHHHAERPDSSARMR